MSEIQKIMAPYRQRIDDLDNEIVDLLVQRIGIIREVGVIKHEHDIPSTVPWRVDEVRERNADRAAAKGEEAEIFRQLYALLIAYSCDLEDVIKAELNATPSKSVNE